MPKSKKQRAANRKNARKSTGPKTPEGNSLKHGLFARDVIIDSEPLEVPVGGVPRSPRRSTSQSQNLSDSEKAAMPPTEKPDACVNMSAFSLRSEADLQDWPPGASSTSPFGRHRLTPNKSRCAARLDDAVNVRDRLSALYSACDDDSNDASPEDPRTSDDNDSTPESASSDDDDDREMSDLIGKHSIPTSGFAHTLLYYEMRLDRQLTRTYTLLRRIQLYEQAKSLQDQRAANKKRENEPISLYVSPG